MIEVGAFDMSPSLLMYPMCSAIKTFRFCFRRTVKRMKKSARKNLSYMANFRSPELPKARSSREWDRVWPQASDRKYDPPLYKINSCGEIVCGRRYLPQRV